MPPKHLSPLEERHQPEAEAEAKAEADQGEESPPGERGGRSRVKTASGVVQGGGGSSILPYEGHFKSRPTGDKGGKRFSLQVPVRRVVAACSRADSLGSLRRNQASKEFSLDAAGRHSFTSSEVNSHPSESTYRRPLPSGRMVTKGEMGVFEPPGQARFYSNKDCNRGTRIKVDPKKGGTSVSTPSAVEKRIYNSPARDPQLSRNPRQEYSSSRSIFRGMGKRRHSDSRYPRNPRRCLCQSPVHGSQRRCGRTSNNRLVYNELVHRYPKYQDGTSRIHNEASSRTFMGGQGRYQGRLLGSHDSNPLREVFLFLDKRDYVDFKKDAFRPHHSSLDFHQINEGDKETLKEAGVPDKFVHRRLHPVGSNMVPSQAPPRVDEEGPDLVGIQDQCQEDIRVSCSESDLLGSTTRSKGSNLKSPSREDFKAQEHVQVNFNGTAGIQSGSGGIDRFSYLIVLGSALN